MGHGDSPPGSFFSGSLTIVYQAVRACLWVGVQKSTDLKRFKELKMQMSLEEVAH